MNILLDINLSAQFCAMLARHGHHAVYWGDVGAPTAPDTELLSWAREHGFVLLTRDLDFSALVAGSKSGKPSIIQIRRQDVRPNSLLPDLVNILEMYQAQLEDGALVVMGHIRSRVRILPI